MAKRRLSLLSLSAFVMLALRPAPAEAFTTRVHIVLANEIHDALASSGDGTITLRFSNATVQLRAEDAAAILAYPEEFRAGAVGPDNMVFPGVTDPSHAVDLDPYYQCEILYQAVFTERERAYALGCFLHGASDAVAHHYVNFFSGETFTLTPLADNRQFGFGNMIRHIVTESMIQDSLVSARPEAFTAAKLNHDIPRDFVLRTYFEVDSPVWKLLSKHARAKLDAATAANPGATRLEVIQAAGLAPPEHLALLPHYLETLRDARPEIRAAVDAKIATLQADSELGVTAGPDSTLGTPDDQTACSTTCPVKAITYFTYVNMIWPRTDATGNTLPSALDKIVQKLGDDLLAFLPQYVAAIEGLSTLLNAAVTGPGSGFDLTPAALTQAIAPLKAAIDQITTIDSQAIVVAALPTWLITFAEGLSLDLGAYVRDIYQPYIDELRATIRTHVLDQVETFLSGFLAEYEAEKDAIEAAFTTILDNAADPALGGNTHDFITDSGLWGYAFNFVAATLANHEVVVVSNNALTTGPASFDASYTLSWSQAGLCDYLRSAIFPFGVDVAALLSVSTDRLYTATVSGDTPVECHDGSLMAFGTPSVTTCAFTTLDALIADPMHRGTITRAHPPDLVGTPPVCANITVPGLPGPPGNPDAGPGAPDAGNGADGEGGGCCRTSKPGGGSGSIVVLLSLVVIGLRRHWWGSWIGVAMAIALLACGSDSGGSMDAGAPDAAMAMGDADIPDQSGVLLGALGDSTWHATDIRAEAWGSVERTYELHFRASEGQWVEIRNPYGPARRRTLRSFTVDRDGKTVRSLVMSPETWPPHPDNGLRETFQMEVLAGSPRTLRITPDGGVPWSLTEGAVAAPTSGLTASIRAFDTSAGSPYTAFCDNIDFGLSNGVTDPLRMQIWDYARGGAGPLLGEDRTAGATIGTWDGHPWSVTDVIGFRPVDRGGTQLTETQNFVVRYIGVLDHSGGELGFREVNDSIEDAFWVFLGNNVGSTNPDDLFMEVHNYVYPNRTDCSPLLSSFDECFGTFAAGPLLVEIIVIRCTEPLEDPMTLQMSFDSGSSWSDLSAVPLRPIVDTTLFPSPF